MIVQFDLTDAQWQALRDAVEHAWQEVHDSAGMADSWGPFNSDPESVSMEDAEVALGEVLDKFAEVQKELPTDDPTN